MAKEADLIELHVVFSTLKSRYHLERVANHIRDTLQRDLNERFALQSPNVYVADIRGPDDEDDDG